MRRTNWSQIKERRLMRRQGIDVKGGTPIVTTPANKQPRRQLSKAKLRQEAEATVLAWRAGQRSKEDKYQQRRRNEPCKYQASV
jgi:hypothetical protein